MLSFNLELTLFSCFSSVFCCPGLLLALNVCGLNCWCLDCWWPEMLVAWTVSCLDSWRSGLPPLSLVLVPTKLNWLCCISLTVHCNQPLLKTAGQCTSMHYTALQCNTMHCNVLQCTARHCSALKWTAIHCNALQSTAMNCTALQYNAM